VRADAGDARVGQNFFEFGSRVFGETGETVLGVTDGGAEFDGRNPASASCLMVAGEIFGDHFADGPGLQPMGRPRGLRGAAKGHEAGDVLATRVAASGGFDDVRRENWLDIVPSTKFRIENFRLTSCLVLPGD